MKEKIKTKKFTIHFVGIKGVGMTPLAVIAKEAGFEVSGSDIEEEFITDTVLKSAGITPLVGFAKEHILEPDLVITSSAHEGFDNIEVKTAHAKKIRVITQGEAVGEFMSGKLFGKKLKGISIAGSHGKTTTTAIIATVLRENKLDPSFVVGTGNVGSLGLPGHFGKGNYFIAEADEYATEPKHDKKPKFLWQHPEIVVFTNIEFDHPDIYPTLEDVYNAYLSFAKQLPPKGLLIACGDDRQVKRILQDYKGKVVTYGFNPDNTYILKRVTISGEQTFFWVTSHGTDLGEFVIKVSGEHNALNALAAIITGTEIGIPLDKIKKSLLSFTGSKRRLEFVGDLATGAKVYDDYAHHPTEIKKTLETLQKQYPHKKIICVFQPHMYSRTKALFNDFIRAFGAADMVILTDIYASLREAVDTTVSSFVLADAMKSHHKHVEYLSTLEDVVEYLKQKRLKSDTVLVSMGAGDVYKIHSKLEFA